MAAGFRFELFGPLTATRDGVPIKVSAARQRAVLALLLLEVGRSVPVRRLIEEIWGEDAPDSAVNNLQVQVSALRRALGAASPRTPHQEGPLVTTQGGYALNVAQGAIDIHRFNLLVRQGQGRLKDGDVQEAAALLREALDLWRGEPLAEFGGLAFADAARAGLRVQRLTAVTDRVEADLALGRHLAVADELNGLVTAEPLHERLRGQLMLALYRAGQQADALHVYAEGRQVLADQLGVDPAPELQNLQLRILQQDATLDGPRPVPHPREDALARALPRNTLVGREDEARDVRSLLDATPLVTLIGPGGCGKTRLALEVATAYTRETGRSGYLVQLEAIKDNDQILPAIAGALGVEQKTGPLEEALTLTLNARRAVLVLDNLEHLSGAGAVLRGLVRSARSASFLATSRRPLSLQDETSYPLGPLDQQRQPRKDDESPQLESESAAVRLFLDRARQARPRWTCSNRELSVVHDIAAIVDGLPLAIEIAAGAFRSLTLHELRDRLLEFSYSLRSGHDDVPERHRTVAAAIAWSYERLSEQQRGLLMAAAVFDSTWPASAVIEVAGLSEHLREAEETLATLVEQSLVVEIQPVRQYRILRPILAFVRAQDDYLAVAGDLAQRHYQWCVAWATAVLSQPNSVRSPDDASHSDDLRRALEHALMTSRPDGALLLLEAYLLIPSSSGSRSAVLTVAQRVIEQSDPQDSHTRVRLNVIQGQLLEQLGSYEAAAAAYQSAISYEGHNPQASPHVVAVYGLASALRRQGRLLDARETIERLPEQDQNSRSRLELGRVLLSLGDTRAARAVLERGLQEAASGTAEEIDLLVHLARTESADGQLDAAAFHAGRAHALALRRDAPHHLVLATRVLGGIMHERGDFEAAARTLRDGIHAAERSGDLEEVGGCLVNLGLVELDRGHLEEARSCDERAVEHFRRIHHGPGLAIACANLAEKYLRLGRHHDGLLAAEEAVALAQRQGDQLTLIDGLLTLSELLAALHDPAQARAAASEAADRADRAGVTALLSRAKSVLASCDEELREARQ